MPSRWFRCCLLLAAAGLGTVWAAPKKPATPAVKDQEKLVESCRGSFDMAGNPRPYAVYLVLDQADNPWPSFWSGTNAGGTVHFDGQYDELEDRVMITQTGTFTMSLTNTARKPGMFDRLPGGVWAERPQESGLKVTFEEFRDGKIVGTRADAGERGAGGNLVQVETKCRGQVTVMGRSAPFAGTAMLEFSAHVSLFRLVATFPFPGAELGLAGKSGAGITATIHTSSTPAARNAGATLD